MLRDFLSDEDDQANAAYRSMSSNHSSSAGLVNAAGMETGAPEVINPEFDGPGQHGATGGRAGHGNHARHRWRRVRTDLAADEWTQDPAGFGTGLAGAGGGGPMSVGAPSSVPGGLGGLSPGGAGGLAGGAGGLAGGGGGLPSSVRPVRPYGAARAAWVACRWAGAAGAGSGRRRYPGGRGRPGRARCRWGRSGGGGAGGMGGMPMMGGAGGGAAGARGGAAGAGRAVRPESPVVSAVVPGPEPPAVVGWVDGSHGGRRGRRRWRRRHRPQHLAQ